jgi:hypothetical protein
MFFCKEPQILFLGDQQDARVKIYVIVTPNGLNFNSLHGIDFVVPIQYYHVALSALTFKNRASYTQDGRTATLQLLHFIYFFQQI